jgi:hypothetical protein
LPPLGARAPALGLTVAAAKGVFALQHCAECGTVQYPPRDACANACPSNSTGATRRPDAQVIAETRIHASPDPYFRERLPWRMGREARCRAPWRWCHLHGDVARGDVRLSLQLDKAGQGVMWRCRPKGPTQWRTIRSCAA